MSKCNKKERQSKISVSDFALYYSAFVWILIILIELLIK